MWWFYCLVGLIVIGAIVLWIAMVGKNKTSREIILDKKDEIFESGTTENKGCH